MNAPRSTDVEELNSVNKSERGPTHTHFCGFTVIPISAIAGTRESSIARMRAGEESADENIVCNAVNRFAEISVWLF
jgi:hypothetical protein